MRSLGLSKKVRSDHHCCNVEMAKKFHFLRKKIQKLVKDIKNTENQLTHSTTAGKFCVHTNYTSKQSDPVIRFKVDID